MNLQTKIPLSKQSNNLIDYKSDILLLGSCFVENIGEKLAYFKFKNEINPFGILFHPKAIETLVENALQGKVYTENDVFFNNEQWHCFDAHSKLSSSSKDNLLNGLNDQIKLTAKGLANSTHIIITLGTAWLYRTKGTGETVANCHKVTQKEFLKELLHTEDIVSSLQNAVDVIRRVNPEVSVIFTVSPVRHLKDGFIENTQSKAHLISAIHQLLATQSGVECLHYFPSYEIMMDELRDYRFYNEDMIHPNSTAVNYIWEKFKQIWIDSEAQKTMLEVDSIQKGLQHKPFNSSSESHKKFLLNLEEKLKLLQSQFPHFNF
ncbi:GSCFA domain-containing protein [Seonamhaeicola maritimus]|uniref:GSCFA domain-containing protein n=1 Tax=Seonamhaeicola maritimus TaxID=2591822 RepID=UPI0024948638|nr:GSCFA domain-containing protein [Seonamhaeicola maritimus]